MKEFVIFVLVVATLSQADARKVCILFEQKTVPTTTTVSDQVSVTINEVSSSDAQEDIVITLGELTEDISAITADAITETEATTTVSESSNLITDESTPINVCALEGITLFDDQNVSHFLNTLNS